MKFPITTPFLATLIMAFTSASNVNNVAQPSSIEDKEVFQVFPTKLRNTEKLRGSSNQQQEQQARAGTTYATLCLDTFHTSDIWNQHAGTSDTITCTFYNQDKSYVGSTQMNGVPMGKVLSEWDACCQIPYDTGVGYIKSVVVETNGSDALAIDQAKFFDEWNGSAYNFEKTFGVENAGVWCVSKDANDWSGTTCYAGLEFVDTGKVYVA